MIIHKLKNKAITSDAVVSGALISNIDGFVQRLIADAPSMKDAKLLHREAADQFRIDVMGIANADDAKSLAKKTTDYKKAVTNVLGDLKRATAELTKAHKAFNHNLAAEAEKLSSRRSKLLAGKIKSDAKAAKEKDSAESLEEAEVPPIFRLSDLPAQ